MAKVVVISDIDLKGSGYLNISMPLCDGLAAKGHDIILLGLNYKNEPHNHDFAILGASNFLEIQAMTENLHRDGQLDFLIVALDLPIQANMLKSLKSKPFKYVGIFPIEAPPLCMDWASAIMQMDKAYIISKFGAEEAQKRFLSNAEYFEVGIDTESWRPPTQEERNNIRKARGFENKFVILTIADNQERKNLGNAIEAVARFIHADDRDDVEYVLVTRENNPVGWKLQEYAYDENIGTEMTIIERGISFVELWGLYAAADVFLLPSKTEGLGMPLLEAMAVGVPCIATNFSGMAELLEGGRGYLVESEYEFRDPFGNSWRKFPDKNEIIDMLKLIKNNPEDARKTAEKALEYVKTRSWQNSVDQVDGYLNENSSNS